MEMKEKNSEMEKKYLNVIYSIERLEIEFTLIYLGMQLAGQ